MPSISTHGDRCPIANCRISFRGLDPHDKAQEIHTHNNLYHWLIYCASCGLLFDSPASLTTHSDTRHPSCLLCRRTFTSATEREAHFQMCHQVVYCSKCSYRTGDGYTCQCNLAEVINEGLKQSAKSGWKYRDQGDFHPDKFASSSANRSSSDYKGSSAEDSYKSNWEYRDSSKSKTKDRNSSHHHGGHSQKYESTSGYSYTRTGSGYASSSSDDDVDDHAYGTSYHRPNSTRSAPKNRKAHSSSGNDNYHHPSSTRSAPKSKPGHKTHTSSAYDDYHDCPRPSSTTPKPKPHTSSSIPNSSKPHTQNNNLPSSKPASQPTQTYYTLLSLPPTASPAETLKVIKKARIANHPDRFMAQNLSPAELEKVVERAKCIGQACDVLEDPAARARYDAKLGRDGLWGGGGTTSRDKKESDYRTSSSSGNYSKSSSSQYSGYRTQREGGSPLRNEYKPKGSNGGSSSSSGSRKRDEGFRHFRPSPERRMSSVDEEMMGV
ncbi:MAG: hypothetical protein Q9195_000427 [Heterodermia aff. obscurata]